MAASLETTRAKVVMLGASGVGKTALVARFLDDSFVALQTEGTIGATFSVKVIRAANGKRLKLEIWDTAGQERFHSLAPLYYRSADVAIIVFEATCCKSLKRALQWITELRTDDPRLLVALVANKVDLCSRAEARCISQEQQVLFLETSAKTGQNVASLFATVADALVNRTEINSRNQAHVEPFKLSRNGVKAKKKDSCCASGSKKFASIA